MPSYRKFSTLYPKPLSLNQGSVKDGRRNARSDPAEDEDLHVLVTGDTQEQVDALNPKP